jgi:hypothetical protein
MIGRSAGIVIATEPRQCPYHGSKSRLQEGDTIS